MMAVLKSGVVFRRGEIFFTYTRAVPVFNVAHAAGTQAVILHRLEAEVDELWELCRQEGESAMTLDRLGGPNAPRAGLPCWGP